MPSSSGAADSALTADLATFHDDLAALRAAAGAPSYARLARRIGQPRTTVYDAFRRPSLPALELLTALVEALDGDVEEWRERWTALRARIDSDSGTGTQPPETGARTRSDGFDRPSARWWWLAAALVVLSAAVSAVVTVAVRGGDDGCSRYRLYRITEAGDLLDARSTSVGRTTAGDLVLVGRTDDRTFRARYPALDLVTGRRGYVDESKLDFLRDDICV